MRNEFQTPFSTRQYMLSKDFEIYYYSDSNLTKVQSHYHDYYEFYFFQEGEVSLVINDITYPLHAGDVILIPPQIPHHPIIHSQHTPYRRFVFWISPDYWSKLAKESPDYTYFLQQAKDTHQYILHNDTIVFHSLQAKIFRVLEELNSNHFGRDLSIQIGVKDLLLQLNRMAYEQNHPTQIPEAQSLYHKLLQYIETHLEQSLSLDTLSKEFYVNKYHIAHLFKDTMGLSIHQYITKKRLQSCKDAILSNANLSEVALMFGFTDYSSFYRAFRKEYGISPQDFKKQQRALTQEVTVVKKQG